MADTEDQLKTSAPVDKSILPILPAELLEQILCRLDVKSQVKLRLTCKRWAAAMPMTDPTGRLTVADLPYRWKPKRSEWSEFLYRNVVPAAQINLALSSLLPQAGCRLKCLSFSTSHRQCQLSDATLNLIARFCPLLPRLHLAGVERSSSGTELNLATLSQLTRLNEFRVESTSFFNSSANRQNLVADLTTLMCHWPLTSLSLPNYWPLPVTVVNGRLRSLDLNSCEVSNEQLAEICKKSPNISSLRILGRRSLTDFLPVAKFSDLQQLDMSGNISNDQFQLICERCPRLTQLDLRGCSRLNNFKCLQRLKMLTSLTVDRRFGEKNISEMPRVWPLQKFSGKLTDLGLTTLSQKCPQLTSINMFNCRGIKDSSVAQVVANCSQLQSIDLSYTGITGESLLLLGQSPNLRSLSVKFCKKISRVAFFRLHHHRLRSNMASPLHITVTRLKVFSRQHLSDLSAVSVQLSEEDSRVV